MIDEYLEKQVELYEDYEIGLITHEEWMEGNLLLYASKYKGNEKNFRTVLEVGRTYTTAELQKALGISKEQWQRKKDRYILAIDRAYVCLIKKKGRVCYYTILAQKGEYKPPERKNKAKDEKEPGIYVNDNLVYIGKTSRDYETRFSEHKSKAMKGGDKGMKIYEILREAIEKNDKLECKILIDINKLEIEGNYEISPHDLEAMELALIHVYKPIGNIQGVTMPYMFHKQQKEEERIAEMEV